MRPELNQIPHAITQECNAKRITILACGSHEGEPRLTTTSDPRNLRPARSLEALEAARRDEKVYSILMSVLVLDSELIEHATRFFDYRYRIVSELDTLLRYQGHVYLVYVVTHFNPGWGPAGPLTVNIGGDCYRPEREDLRAVLHRTRDLAAAMTRKAVMIFPDIPALHGGKKGEWILVDEEGKKVAGLSGDAIVALGSAIIPRGIEFLNEYKRLEAVGQGILDGAYPDRGVLRPDSASPDVLSGSYWRGDRPDKYINLCDAWKKRGEDLRATTCLPASLGGTLDSSARPTGYGVATTAMCLARHYFERKGKPLEEWRFLLEAAGGVGRNTIEALIGEYGIQPHQITVFDQDDEALNFVRERFRVETGGRTSQVRAITLPNEAFYRLRLPLEAKEAGPFDVWINNGLGDQTTPEDVQCLLDAGVRVFGGGANNFLVTEQSQRQDALARIFRAGGWAWPDEATSGGGWTLAVLDLRTRSLGEEASSVEIQQQILDTITSRNQKLVEDVVGELPETASGEDVWKAVNDLIEHRVEQSLAQKSSPEAIREMTTATSWNVD